MALDIVGIAIAGPPAHQAGHHGGARGPLAGCRCGGRRKGSGPSNGPNLVGGDRPVVDADFVDEPFEEGAAKPWASSDGDVVVGGVKAQDGDSYPVPVLVKSDAVGLGDEGGGQVLPPVQVHLEAGVYKTRSGEDKPGVAAPEEGPVPAAVVGTDDVMLAGTGAGREDPGGHGEPRRSFGLVDVQ